MLIHQDKDEKVYEIKSSSPKIIAENIASERNLTLAKEAIHENKEPGKIIYFARIKKKIISIKKKHSFYSSRQKSN